MTDDKEATWKLGPVVKGEAMEYALGSAVQAGFDRAFRTIEEEMLALGANEVQQVEALIGSIMGRVGEWVRSALLLGITTFDIHSCSPDEAHWDRDRYVPPRAVRIAYGRILQAVNGERHTRLRAFTEQVMGKTGINGCGMFGLRLMLDVSGLYAPDR